MSHPLNPFKITVVKDVSVVASVILGYKPLTATSSAFWPITERRKLDLKKGQTRSDLDNIEIVAEHAVGKNVQLTMPDKGEPLKTECLIIERCH